jgi:hypothetical protein
MTAGIIQPPYGLALTPADHGFGITNISLYAVQSQTLKQSSESVWTETMWSIEDARPDRMSTDG